MRFLSSKNKRIYLDYASGTPMDKEVAKVMHIYESEIFGNSSAIYKEGVIAKNALENARLSVAKVLGAHSDEIFFTGSATESNSLAILGVIKNYELIIKSEKIPHIITTTLEHSAVFENLKFLEERDLAQVSYVEPEENGIIDPKKIREAIKENTVLVSVMYASNEIGTIQPISEIAKIIRSVRKTKVQFPLLFHTDATQAINYLDINNIEKLGVDLLSFNSSKIYGPKGVGVLYKKRNVTLMPIYKGGGQERGLRSGTENVSGIVGFAKALEITEKLKESEAERLKKIRDHFFSKLDSLSLETGFKIKINGDKKNRLPNNINVIISGISSELLVIELDAKGIAISERSACKAGGENLENTLRITLGRETKVRDIEKLLFYLKSILNKYKKVL